MNVTSKAQVQLVHSEQRPVNEHKLKCPKMVSTVTDRKADRLDVHPDTGNGGGVVESRF